MARKHFAKRQHMTQNELRACREYLELEVDELCDVLGVNRRTYYNWVYGRTPVPGPVVAFLTLACYFDELFDLKRFEVRRKR